MSDERPHDDPTGEQPSNPRAGPVVATQRLGSHHRTAGYPPGSPYPGYPQYPMYYAPMPQYRNGNAITALVLGITGFLCCVTAPVAIVFGVLGMRDVKRGTSDANGFAIAGIVLGILGTLALFGWMALLIIDASTGSYPN